MMALECRSSARLLLAFRPTSSRRAQRWPIIDFCIFCGFASGGARVEFLYLCSSALVAGVATAKEKCRVQGVADLATTTLVDFASISAGRLHSHFGWNILILAG